MESSFNAFDFDRATIGPVDAGENFSQGAFARAILAHDRVAGSGHYVETHVFERNRARKPLADRAKANGGNGRLSTHGFTAK
jgi:hypothetical protein